MAGKASAMIQTTQEFDLRATDQGKDVSVVGEKWEAAEKRR